MILRYAIVGGALELLPQTLATSAMVPMQTQMVYRAGAQRGFDLDRKSFVELITAAGPGMAWQVFEDFARRLTGRLGKTVAGMAMSFGTTYALGQLAKLYYDSGRSMST